jgi:hypothetical protein
MVQADLFGPLPGEGSWSHVLLADGNIGIGGDPGRPAHPRRSAARPRRDGAGRGRPAPRTRVARYRRVLCGSGAGEPIPWAAQGAVPLAVTAGRAGLRVTDVHLGARVFLELTGP